MDFELSDEEVALAESVRSICAGKLPIERLQQAATTAADGGGAFFDSDIWSALGSAGVFSLQVPESAGGVGLGTAAATVVFEELGRALVPGPLVASHLAARLSGSPAEEGGVPVSAELPDGVGEGEVAVGAVRRSSDSGPEALAPRFVGNLSSIGALIVVGDDDLSLVDPVELDASEVVGSLDPLTPMWHVAHLPRGKKIAGASEAARWRRDESILTGALLVGLAGKCVEMAVSYAKEREQFGKPIGSFQAVKHICADMLVRAETARAAVQAAGVTADQPDVGDPLRAASGAALLAAEAANANAKGCIQVHGGMGFTWEVPAHLYLMRARVLTRSLGGTGELAETVADRY